MDKPSLEVLSIQAQQITQQLQALRESVRDSADLSTYEREQVQGLLFSCWLLSYPAASTLAAVVSVRKRAITEADRKQAEEASSRG